VCATVATVYSPKTAASGPEITLKDTGKSRDVAAALEAKFHGHGPGEKAIPGTGGTKQYDLPAVSAEAPSEAQEAAPAEAAEKPAAEGPEAATPSPEAGTEAAAGPEAGAPSSDAAAATAEAEPDSAEVPPIVAMPAGPHGTVAAPAPAAAKPPGYLGVRIMGIFYIVCGLACWLIGLGVMLYLVADILQSGDLRAAVLSASLFLAIAFGLFILGLVQVGMGQLFLCVRDMARNSFHLRKL
jgi:hypothetical protein